MEYADAQGRNYNKPSCECYLLSLILLSNIVDVCFNNTCEDFLFALEECTARRKRHLS